MEKDEWRIFVENLANIDDATIGLLMRRTLSKFLADSDDAAIGRFFRAKFASASPEQVAQWKIEGAQMRAPTSAEPPPGSLN